MAEEEKKKEEGEEGTPEAAAPKKSKKTLLIVIGGVLFLVLAVGAPAAYFMLKEKKAPEVAEADPHAIGQEPAVPEGADEGEDELTEEEESIGAIFPLESFIVNLSGGRYVRLQAQLEFQGREVPKRFYTKLVPLRDALITLLSKQTQEDLSTDKGREGLKQDIKDITNELLRREEVKRVYFTQFVVQ